MNPYILPEGNIQISFSGGRTSAYMLHQILKPMAICQSDARLCLPNTGREMPQTLDFVHECGSRWNVPIVWLEYDRRESKPTRLILSATILQAETANLLPS
jgi:3'-phosphoadenosine 5'-phosphosulfate sulfotransferase (PAPS reductase)/FAD synthetase